MNNTTTNRQANNFLSLSGTRGVSEALSLQKTITNAIRAQTEGIVDFIKNNQEEQTIELVMMAVEKNGLILKHVKEDLKTTQVIELALKQNGRAIAYISNPTEEQCVLAVQMNPHAISEIKNKTEKVCLEAVKRNGLVLNYIQTQTKEVCLEAIKQNPVAMRYIRPNMHDKDFFSIAVEKDWRLLEFVPKEMQDMEIAMIAYQQNPEAEKYFQF